MCNCNRVSGAIAFPNFVANGCCNSCCDTAVVAQKVDSVSEESCGCGCCCCCCKCCGCGNVGGINTGCSNVGGVSDTYYCPPEPPCCGYVDPIWGCIDRRPPDPFCPCMQPYGSYSPV